MSNNPVRKAKMEEANNEYLDTGCPEVAPSCLKCPLPECKGCPVGGPSCLRCKLERCVEDDNDA